MTRTHRRAPHTARSAKAAPTTRAQFAPDTAVRCDSDDSVMAVSVAASRPDVSPTASPGMSPAPGCGSPRVEATSPSRSPSNVAHTPCGGGARSTSFARSTRAARSAGSAGIARPESTISLPCPATERRSRSSASTPIRAGITPRTVVSPADTVDTVASNQAPPSALPDTWPVIVAVTRRWRPPSISRSATACRVGASVATVPPEAAAHASAIVTTSSAGRRNRTKTTATAADVTASPTATIHAAGAAVVTAAPLHVAVATASGRHARFRRARRSLIPAPDPAGSRASCRRSPGPIRGRPRS